MGGHEIKGEENRELVSWHVHLKDKNVSGTPVNMTQISSRERSGFTKRFTSIFQAEVRFVWPH